MTGMNSLSEASASLRRLPRRGAALLLVLILGGVALSLVAVLLALRDGSDLGLAAIVLTALCTSLLLLAVGALGWHVGVRLTRQRLGDALREARLHAQALAQLQPLWQWATDAQHRLVRWQAPQGALASSWVGNTATQSLCERFACIDDAAPGGLPERLQAQLNFAELRVRASDATAGVWVLRGIACFDGQGRFSGYQGTAQLELQPAGWPWLEAMPQPACVLSDDQPAARVLALNTAAAALGLPGVGEDWVEGQAGWTLSPFKDGSGRHALACLQLQAAATPATPVTDLPNEHESFSYTVSHDLRAPLRVVEGFARILKEDYGRLLDRIGNDHLDRVMGAAARMNCMIDSLLSLAQLSMQPLAHQPVNLSQLAEFVIEELRRSTPERAVDIHIQPQLQVQGDPTLLRMVLENLLGNAWKYSGKCARAQISFEARQDEGLWVYAVGDNGAGFDMRFADRLFGVFQRLHSASDFQGTGVGLASVRRIVRRHGGDIWAESEVGAGARFYFTLESSSTASTRRSA